MWAMTLAPIYQTRHEPIIVHTERGRERERGGVTNNIAAHVASQTFYLIERVIDTLFKRLLNGHARQCFQLVGLRLFNEILHLILLCSDGLIDAAHGRFVGNSVANAHGEAVMQQPIIDDRLCFVEEAFRGFWSVFVENHVHQAALRPTQCLFKWLGTRDVNNSTTASRNVPTYLFAQNTAQQFTRLDQHARVTWRHERFLFRRMQCHFAVEIDVGQNQREHLFARPQRFWLQDSRLNIACNDS